jgi:hypothetical protein
VLDKISGAALIAARQRQAGLRLGTRYGGVACGSAVAVATTGPWRRGSGRRSQRRRLTAPASRVRCRAI